ncbi:MAG: hypothetical protein JEY79_17245 [Pseudodesulfovibrio sp.]|nr:hypothetical protein [Pseudodesulfovibrio sp.]
MAKHKTPLLDRLETGPWPPVEIYRIDKDGKAVLTECASCVSDDRECESCAVYKDHITGVDHDQQ